MPAIPTPPPPPPPRPAFTLDPIWRSPGSLRAKILNELAIRPFSFTPDLVHLDKHRSRQTISRIATEARAVLGIQAGSGSGAARIRHRARYEAVCKILNVPPISGNVGPDRYQRDRDRAKLNAAQATPVAGTPIIPPRPAPVPVTPTPASEAILEACVRLLAEMRAQGFVSITIQGDGTVTWEKRTIQKGSAKV